MMMHAARFLALLALLALPGALAAQGAGTATTPDSTAKASMADHVMSPWKEMNTFHMAMAATWHPAEKDDLAPLRARIDELVKAAEGWSASKAPMMPHACGGDSVRTAITKLAGDVKSLAAAVKAGGEDQRLKGALKAIHDAFEGIEKSCTPGEHK